MENQKNDNLNLLEAVVQNTEMGKNTLEQIVPMTEDPAFRAELLRERNLYRELNQEAHTAIEACGGTAQGQSIMAKLNTKMGIGMKTLTDRSTRNLAEMLSEGSSPDTADRIFRQKRTEPFQQFRQLAGVMKYRITLPQSGFSGFHRQQLFFLMYLAGFQVQQCRGRGIR